MVKVTLALPEQRDERWTLARQAGVEYAHPHSAMGQGRLGRYGTDNSDKPDVSINYDEMLQMKTAFEHAGFEIPVIGMGGISDVTRLGKSGRDEEIEAAKQVIQNAGALDIPVVTYSWMTRFWWMRTDIEYPLRGGSLTTVYDHEQSECGPKEDVDVSEEELWENLEYMLERLVPVAEDVGVKLALHPDDPPLSPVRGVPRIITSVEAYDRVLDLYPSEANGISFCMGNFAAMGADIPEAIQHFQNHIHYAHFRDIEGDAEHFTEVWHDEGPTDMLEALRTFRKIGFNGSIRPDHLPSMEGETNERPGYEMKGRLFAIGYMRGLLEQADTDD